MSNENSFTNTSLDLSTKNIIEYYIDFKMMLNKAAVNTSTITPSDVLSYFLAYPHLIVQDPSDKLIKYANTQYGTSSVYYPMKNINNYEWNSVILSNYLDTALGKWIIQVYVNGKFNEPDVNIAISNVVYDMKLLGVAFCQQNFPTCMINRISQFSKWGSAWYRHLRIWDYQTSSILTIYNFERL